MLVEQEAQAAEGGQSSFATAFISFQIVWLENSTSIDSNDGKVCDGYNEDLDI